MRAFQRRRVADTWDARAYQSHKIDDIAGSNNTSHRCGVDRRASRHRHGTNMTADESRSNNDEDTGTQWRLAGLLNQCVIEVLTHVHGVL